MDKLELLKQQMHDDFEMRSSAGESRRRSTR
jgi:hypothetical protein